MAPTLRVLQIPALPVSVHSGELISSAAWAVPTMLNSDAATARLAVRIIMSFPHTELAESRAAHGLRASFRPVPSTSRCTGPPAGHGRGTSGIPARRDRVA